MTKHKNKIQTDLQNLKLHHLAVHLDDFIAKATKGHLSPMQTVETLVKLELEEIKRRSVDSRLKSAKLGKFGAMSTFDWNWPKNIPKQTVENLFNLSFVEEPANVILIGSAGLGKTMIAKNLGYQVAMSGQSVLFVETAAMLTDLGACDSPSLFKRQLARYIRPNLLILDEVGYLSSLSVKSADILFQVVSQRYEKTSTVVTTNKAFKEWGEVFPGAACIYALVDRLTHRSEIILIEGDSYRQKESEERHNEAESIRKKKGKA